MLPSHSDVHDPLTCELCHAEGMGAEIEAVRRQRDRYLRMLHELIAIAGRPGDGGLFNATMQVRDRLNEESR